LTLLVRGILMGLDFLQTERHKTAWHGRCYFCICQVCNLRNCRRGTRFEHCMSCLKVNRRAILGCDQFESRYVRKVFKVKRERLKSRYPNTTQMIRDIWQRLK